MSAPPAVLPPMKGALCSVHSTPEQPEVELASGGADGGKLMGT